MSKKVAELLKGLPVHLHDSFFKVVEHDFWEFQYLCRHFQMRYHESANKKFPSIEIRKFPYFSNIAKILKNKYESLQRDGESEETIKTELENILREFKKLVPTVPDEVIAAWKVKLFEGKHSPRKKLKNQFFTTDLMDLMPSVLERLATQECGVSSPDFERMIVCQLTLEEWERNESIQRFCDNIQKKMLCAMSHTQLERSMFDLENGDPERQARLRLKLYIQEKELGSDYIQTSLFLHDVCNASYNEFGMGYYLYDFFRSTDFRKISSFDVGKYSCELKSFLTSDVFWQPVLYESAIGWILERIIGMDELEPYIAIKSDTFKGFSDYEYSMNPMWDSNVASSISIFVNCLNNDSVADLHTKINSIEEAIMFRIARLKKLSAYRRKRELEKEDVVIYLDNIFKVVINPTDDEYIYLRNYDFLVEFNINHKDFKPKKLLDRLRFIYVAHIYAWEQLHLKLDTKLDSKISKYTYLIDDAPIMKNFKFGTMSRPIGLFIWDKVYSRKSGENIASEKKRVLSAIADIKKLISSEDNPDCTKYNSTEYLRKIYEITKKCIAEKKVLPIS